MRTHSVAGGRVDPSSSSPNAPSTPSLQQARSLLNSLSGYERYPSSVDAAALSTALKDFQFGAGLPETGQPDAATLAALEREAERVAAARAETDAAVDAALESLDERRPQVARSASDLADAAISALQHPSLLDAHAGVRRGLLGIPAARTTRSGREVDGWVARSEGHARRVGLNAGGRLLVRASIEQLAQSADVRAQVVDALDGAEALYGRLDAGLVLAVTARESRSRAFEDRGGRVNMFFGGGIDFLADQMRDRSLFTEAEVRGWRLGDQAENEHGVALDTVLIPHRDQTRAYAGAVEHAQRTLEDVLRARVGEERAEAILRELDPTSRRMWVSLAFTAPHGRAYAGENRHYGRSFGLETVLGRLEARSPGDDLDLSSIADPDPFLDQFSHFRRARVTAAEAELFDVALDDEGIRGAR